MKACIFFELFRSLLTGSNKRNLPHPVFQNELAGKNTDCTYKQTIRMMEKPDDYQMKHALVLGITR
jgi:hypothetical protein